MSYPTNILQQVQIYNKSEIAYLQNICPMLATSNTKFKNFENFQGNLGSSTTFDLPYRFNAAQGLVADWQGIEQLTQTLTCDQAENISVTISDPQQVFNFQEKYYMERIGKGAVLELGSQIEANVAKNANSSVPVNTFNGSQLIPTGALHTESGPYRFYGDGTTPINSFTQLAEMIALFKAYGGPQEDIKVYLPNNIVPQIVGTGLSQFAPKRNDEIAMSWEIGEYGAPRVKYYESNVLPTHIAGAVGQQSTLSGRTLTVVSTNDPTGQNITQITFSGAPITTTGAIKSGDVLQFTFGVSGFPDLYYLTYVGHVPSVVPVQIRATADANSDGAGNVTVSIYPALQSTSGKNQNLSYNIVAGMKAAVAPSHRAGLVVGGNAMYISMPRLPDQMPFPTSAQIDMQTGVSLRLYYGAIFGQATQGLIRDATWGSTIVPTHCMRILFPTNQ